jgi:putative nucleotidyltransferase with HDIG domain
MVWIKLRAALPINDAMRASRMAPVCLFGLGLVAVAVAAVTSHEADWRQPILIFMLTGLALVADRYEFQTSSGTTVICTHPAFVLAMVAAGPAPALVIGEIVILALIATGRMNSLARLAGNAGIYAVFLVVGGLAARLLRDHLHIAENSAWSMVLVVGVFLMTWAINVALVALFLRWLEGRRLDVELAATWRPLMSTQIALACGTALLAWMYAHVGVAVIPLAGIALAAYSRLQRDLLQAEHHAEVARRLVVEAQAQRDGLVRIIIDFVDARDHMTARHSAAVARYAQRIARAAGCTDREQRLVHTAALFHDVGKIMFTDRMFQAGKLNDEEWETVKRHPERGAELVGHLPDHAEIAEIILAHHERIDGRGYPRGLVAEDIPRLSRMISIADTYDVMTGRDSYRQPVSSDEAIAELRRVSGTQLDAELVEVFIEDVLAAEGIAFRHGDDADFEAELEVERGSRAQRQLAPALETV